MLNIYLGEKASIAFLGVLLVGIWALWRNQDGGRPTPPPDPPLFRIHHHRILKYGLRPRPTRSQGSQTEKNSNEDSLDFEWEEPTVNGGEEDGGDEWARTIQRIIEEGGGDREAIERDLNDYENEEAGRGEAGAGDGPPNPPATPEERGWQGAYRHQTPSGSERLVRPNENFDFL